MGNCRRHDLVLLVSKQDSFTCFRFIFSFYLSNDLVVMEILLGWVLMGKVNIKLTGTPKSSSMIVTSMITPNMSNSDMWSLDVLGIKDPICIKTESKRKSAESLILSCTLMSHALCLGSTLA